MNLENKFFIDNYLLTSPRYMSIEKKFLVVSDLHYHNNVNFGIYKLLIQKISKIKPNYVLIPGDFIETIDIINLKDQRIKLESIVKRISEICPVIVIPGNHDFGNFSSIKDRLNLEKGNNFEYLTKSIEYFDSWNKFDNVYFLNNNQVTIDDICFLGFNPDISTYVKVGDKTINKIFIENYLKSGLKVDKNKYNILLTHSPLPLFEDNIKNSIDDFNNIDLFVTGHMHDGYLPKCLDKYFNNTNIGIFITPLVKPYPGLVCRGMHKYKRGYVFISQGFRKYTHNNILFNFMENFVANDIETISIKKGEKCKVKKI